MVRKAPKTPKLSLVQPGQTDDKVPATLGEHGRTLWRSITDEYDIDDAGGLQILQQICAAADRVAELAEQIERDGLMIMGRHGMKDHPALRHELSGRAFITRNLQRLGLNVEMVRPVGRPPGPR